MQGVQEKDAMWWLKRFTGALSEVRNYQPAKVIEHEK
jgi:hypothetical protein